LKILITEPLAEEGISFLKEQADVDIREHLDKAALLELIGEYDAVIVRSGTKVDAEVIEAGTNLKVIGRSGTGIDNVDVETATRHGITVVNAPQAVSIANAEHTMALMLSLARSIPEGNTSLRAGRWEREKFTGVELAGKTLGLVGLGRVGTLVAQRAHAFGMRIIAADPYVSKTRAGQLGIEIVPHDELYRSADFIAVLVTKTPETSKLIGPREFGLMKDGVRIINTSRGGIIDEAALAQAIESGKVAGAALDVFEKEPPGDSPLFGMPQVVVTPHLGASTEEAQAKAAVTVAEQVVLALQGQFAPYAVNLEGGTEFVEALKPFIGLTERLGRVLTGLGGSGIYGVTFEYLGGVAEHDTRILTLSGLKGIFAPVVQEPVTYVNAALVASERGIEVRETQSSSSPDFVDLVVLKAETDDGPLVVGGSLVGKREEQRIVRVYDYEIDMQPERYMCFLRYEDRPGIIGKVGTVLGDAAINIASMHVSRETIGGEALMGLTLDSPLDADVINSIAKAIAARDIKFIDLES
jgi:D-3-phosphoglycerate dehydrogenase